MRLRTIAAAWSLSLFTLALTRGLLAQGQAPEPPAPVPPEPVEAPATAAGSEPAAAADAGQQAPVAAPSAEPASPPGPGAASAPALENGDELEFESTAEVSAPPREVTKRTVSAATIRRIPGTRGDALRAIEIMPGVARTSATGQGDPILRGSAAGESQTYLDGVPVPFLFHFGGITSFMSSHLLEKLDVYPSNFSTRYGRAVGGVVEVTARDPARDRCHGALDLNLIDSSVFAEAPVTDRLSVAAAVRRSNIDFVFENFVPDDTYDVVAAPTYYDYQAIASYRISDHTKLRVLGYGSRDSLELFFSAPDENDPGLAGSVRGKIQFNRVGVELSSQSNAGVRGSANVTFGQIDTATHLGEAEQTFSGQELHGRGEASFELGDSLRMTAGADFFGWLLDGRYHGPEPTSDEGDPRSADPLGSQRFITVADDSIPIAQPGAYVELGYRPVPALLLTPGLRIDYLANVHATTVDPRLSARYELSPHTVFKGGVGYYSQPPQAWQAIPGIGNPDIAPYHALQTSAGVEQELGESAKVTAEGFYKRVTDIVVGTPNREAPYFENSGQGRSFGAEFSGEAQFANEGFAYLAYTLSRSERRREGEPFRLFDSDQTHVLTLAASQGLGHGWDVGLRFRIVSGNPTTPITGATYDARTGVYLPNYGAINSDREAMFHQLDLRVEKAWKLGRGSLAAYLDLQNAYNAQNAEGYRYSFDYAKREVTTGLPLFPNLGLRGEL